MAGHMHVVFILIELYLSEVSLIEKRKESLLVSDIVVARRVSVSFRVMFGRPEDHFTKIKSS